MIYISKPQLRKIKHDSSKRVIKYEREQLDQSSALKAIILSLLVVITILDIDSIRYRTTYFRVL